MLLYSYQLLQIIGQGTFSVLWSAEDKYRNMNQVKNNTPVYKKVAIKMMFPEYSDYGKQVTFPFHTQTIV
jgi:serine/threonine protein kinase